MDWFDFLFDWLEKYYFCCDWLDYVIFLCDYGLDIISFRMNIFCYSDLLILSVLRFFKYDFDFKFVFFYKGNLVY